ncbi:hypothetical protein PCANC_18941 [Puccinia coronata f. sp. avenae]|uniref:DUF6589 domain-containing protein n=1 Tax=Puccinia coronata f. sp. avenae TaxID=200324 RepID=A0A2N5SJ66_9BASI|nr:hypothetical protein PCANC_18941 [Puccinia coronata f. sp. avenae]
MWESVVLSEATDIIDSQKPASGYYPMGLFQSSTTINHQFLSDDTHREYATRLAKDGMPFFYNLLHGVLIKSPDTLGGDCVVQVERNDIDAEGLEMEEICYKNIPSASSHRMESVFKFSLHRNFGECDSDVPFQIASTVCGMIAYARNRHHNGIQLCNTLQLMGCGVTDRVNHFLMHNALACGQRVAMASLKTLAAAYERQIKDVFADTYRNRGIGPNICIDNLDIEERVHTHALGNRTQTFHGTWGYIHLPSEELAESLDWSEINLQSFEEAMKKVPNFPIQPRMLMPNRESNDHYKQVWLSEIARVFSQHIGTPDNVSTAISLNPPVIEQISRVPPKIWMLKLMDAPENSAEGMGQVLDSIAKQAGMPPEEFFSKLLLVDGDLATCQNFNSLRSLRAPSKYVEHSLKNICFQLGASHTLWNVAHCILKTHLGDPKHQSDTGAWRVLHALGVPHEKAMPHGKKDFSLMVKYIEQVHEATILYGLKVVMKTEDEPLAEFNEENPKPVIPSHEYNKYITDFYNKYCSGDVRAKVYEDASSDPPKSSPKLSSLLIRLHEFSTVVEANRAMKAGDVGRLLNVWKMWAVMAQGLKGLTNYASYLPRTILLLNEILPPSLAKLFRHSLLFSPSGRDNHFVAKDFYLEIQNYWLKFVYNQSGQGTQIERLKNIFSLNIHLLRQMLNSIRSDTGAKVFTQSHKNILLARALNVVVQMGRKYNIFDPDKDNDLSNPEKWPSMVDDSFVTGVAKLQNEYRLDPNYTRFKKHMATGLSADECDMDKEPQPGDAMDEDTHNIL